MVRMRFIAISHKKIIAIIAAGLIVVVLLVVVTAVLVLHHNQASSQAKKISRAKINTAAKSGNCSRGLTLTNSEEPNPNNVKGTIALLSYRGYCLEATGHHQEAINTLQKLVSYYEKEHNTVYAQGTEAYIATIKQQMSNQASQATNSGLTNGVK